MAKPIKETPTLSGKDAKRFTEKLTEVEKQKASKSEYERVMESYGKLKEQATF